MAQAAFEIIIILLLTCLNGFFALAEIAVVSSRKARLQQLAEQGSKGAAVALGLAEKPENFLSTIQLGITLIGIFAGAYGGVTLATKLSTVIEPYLGPSYSSPVSFLLVVGSITVLSVIIGELLPKRIALLNPERFACALSQPVAIISKLLGFAITLISGFTEAIVKRLNIPESDNQTVSQEEIAIMVEKGAEEGVIHQVEEEMVKKVLRLDKWSVNALMTPRPNVIWIDINSPTTESWETMVSSGRSHFPVCDGTVDNLLGVISLKELLKTVLAREQISFRDFIKKALIIPSGTSVLKVIEQLKSEGTHFAIIMDEHGSFDGIVTLHDILESLVGIVSSEEEGHQPEIITREDGSWLMDAGVHIDQVKDTLELRELPEEDRGFQTLRGFIMAHLGAIPREGERFTWQGFRFEIIDMDGHMIDKVLVQPVVKATVRSGP
jgi:putative hemolysin